MHWFQSVDSAGKQFSAAVRSAPEYNKMMKDGAVYTVSCGPARCGYPQAGSGRNSNVYISLLTLSGHLRTLAALRKVRPGFGRLNDQVISHETHISAQ